MSGNKERIVDIFCECNNEFLVFRVIGSYRGWINSRGFLGDVAYGDVNPMGMSNRDITIVRNLLVGVESFKCISCRIEYSVTSREGRLILSYGYRYLDKLIREEELAGNIEGI